MHIPTHAHTHTHTHMHKHTRINGDTIQEHIFAEDQQNIDIGWLRLVGSSKLYVSFAKEPYERLYSAKETYDFKEPTNRSHPIPNVDTYMYQIYTYTATEQVQQRGAQRVLLLCMCMLDTCMYQYLVSIFDICIYIHVCTYICMYIHDVCMYIHTYI